MNHRKGVLMVLVLCLAALPARADDGTRMREIIQNRLEPARRERVLKLWNDTEGHPAQRAQLVTALEALDTKMKPDWTGLTIGGGTVALASGIGAGVLAAKLGAAGVVAGPVGVVAGVALGGLIGYGIHKYHQRKAVEGGVFSRAGRRLGLPGRGLDGDLARVEQALNRANAPPPAPKPHWWQRARAARSDDLNTDDLRNGGR